MRLIDSKEREFYIDEEDFIKISKYTWYICPDGYATTHCKKIGTIRLHRLIMGVNKGDKIKVDHINGDTKDCRKFNLRLCDDIGSARNRGVHKNNKCGMKGVCWDKDRNKYAAYIVRISGKSAWRIGRYNTLIEAALAYDTAARKYHKEYARLNFKYGIG